MNDVLDVRGALDPGDGNQTRAPGDGLPVARAPTTVEHVTSGTCWCQPVTTYEDPATGERVFVHLDRIQ